MIHSSRVIQQGIDQRLHLGARLYVSIDARSVIDLAMGQASPGVPMRGDLLMPYLSSGKPLAAVVAASLMEQGLLRLSDPVRRFIPAFTGGGKDGITLAHILNHTAGLGGSLGADSSWDISDWDAAVARVCAYELPSSWVVGQTAAYDPAASWLILGEVLQRVTSMPFAQLMRQQLFDPLEMRDLAYAWTAEELALGADRFCPMYLTRGSPPRLCSWSQPRAGHPPLPGASARGPVQELARFYEALLQMEILQPSTLSQLTAPSRGKVHDRTFGREMDWGLGFLVDNGPDAPYGAGVLTHPGVFGHGGQQSSLAFCDPARRLVFVAIFNGLCGEVGHHRRLQALLQAVKDDLQL